MYFVTVLTGVVLYGHWMLLRFLYVNDLERVGMLGYCIFETYRPSVDLGLHYSYTLLLLELGYFTYHLVNPKYFCQDGYPYLLLIFARAARALVFSCFEYIVQRTAMVPAESGAMQSAQL